MGYSVFFLLASVKVFTSRTASKLWHGTGSVLGTHWVGQALKYPFSKTFQAYNKVVGWISPGLVNGSRISTTLTSTNQAALSSLLAGIKSGTITKLDQEITNHWDSAVHTAAMRWGM